MSKKQSILEADEERTKNIQEFMGRAKKADEALKKVQEKFGVNLSVKSRFQYLDEGISVKSETIWLNNIKK